MDVVRSYLRLQSIGKVCTVGAWIVLAIGLLLFGYVVFIFYPGVNAYAVGSSYLIQLLVILGILIIPTGGVALLLFASGALIEYITIQDGPSEDDGDQDDGRQAEIVSIPNDERNALA